MFDYKSQPKEDVTECNLCGGLQFSLLARQDRYGLPVGTYLCAGCGLGFISPKMTREAYAEFYASGAYRELAAQFTPSANNPQRREQLQEKYAQIAVGDFLWPHLKNSQAKGWILDVGGGTGVVSKVIQKMFGYHGSKVVDPSGEGDEAMCFEDYQHEPGWVDLLLMCQTIDHVLDIKACLAKAHEMLSESGRMFLDVVDFYWMAMATSGIIPALKVDHPYSLTDTTMTVALECSGFRIIQKDYSMRNHVGYLCAKDSIERSPKPYNPLYAMRLLEDLRTLQAKGGRK